MVYSALNNIFQKEILISREDWLFENLFTVTGKVQYYLQTLSTLSCSVLQ